MYNRGGPGNRVGSSSPGDRKEVDRFRVPLQWMPCPQQPMRIVTRAYVKFEPALDARAVPHHR